MNKKKIDYGKAKEEIWKELEIYVKSDKDAQRFIKRHISPMVNEMAFEIAKKMASELMDNFEKLNGKLYHQLMHLSIETKKRKMRNEKKK